LVTVDGQSFNYGDTDSDFSIESIGKPLLYSMAIEDFGYNYVHQYVGKEPSGTSSNSFTLNYEKKAHNACINAGAIAVSGLFHPELDATKKFQMLSSRFEDFAGSQKIGFNQIVYLSQKDSSHDHFALTYFMASEGGFPEKKVKISDALDFFFQVCSMEVTCEKLAAVASMYANYGNAPFTNKKTLSFDSAKKTMQMLFSCGMYDYSGEWAVTIGLPAKSSRTGAIILVIPGVLGMAIYSPRLDQHGNSARGVEFARRLVQKYSWNVFDVLYGDLYNSQNTQTKF